jgi:hypothetical protein
MASALRWQTERWLEMQPHSQNKSLAINTSLINRCSARRFAKDCKHKTAGKTYMRYSPIVLPLWQPLHERLDDNGCTSKEWWRGNIRTCIWPFTRGSTLITFRNFCTNVGKYFAYLNAIVRDERTTVYIQHLKTRRGSARDAKVSSVKVKQ